jgi:hypothetical protein
MACEHKLAWGPLRVNCEAEGDHGPEHEGRYPGTPTVLRWIEGDRRDYTGEYVPCGNPNCILPKHEGNHAF